MRSFTTIQRSAKKKRSSKRNELTLQQIHSIAFGEIGLTPYQYYCMTPYEFACTLNGWMQKRAHQTELVRTQTSFIVNAWLKNAADFSQYWPIPLIDNNKTASKGLSRRGAIAIMKKVQARHDSQYKSQLN